MILPMMSLAGLPIELISEVAKIHTEIVMALHEVGACSCCDGDGAWLIARDAVYASIGITVAEAYAILIANGRRVCTATHYAGQSCDHCGRTE